jgi:hypothetical protein
VNDLITIPFTSKTLTRDSALKLAGLLLAGTGVFVLGRRYLSR